MVSPKKPGFGTPEVWLGPTGGTVTCRAVRSRAPPGATREGSPRPVRGLLHKIEFQRSSFRCFLYVDKQLCIHGNICSRLTRLQPRQHFRILDDRPGGEGAPPKIDYCIRLAISNRHRLLPLIAEVSTHLGLADSRPIASLAIHQARAVLADWQRTAPNATQDGRSSARG